MLSSMKQRYHRISLTQAERDALYNLITLVLGEPFLFDNAPDLAAIERARKKLRATSTV